MVLLSLTYILLSSFLIGANGHASYMSSSYCSTQLTAGTKIMGSSVKTSTTRTVSVLRNGVALASGANYVPGESLTVTISSASNEFVYQTDTGKFVGGGCTGSVRIAGSATATLTAPASGALNIFGGWATGQSTVYLTNTVSLADPNSGSTTTSVPTLAPASSPTNAPVTSKPTTVGQTNFPTLKPVSSAPSVANVPTAVPTVATVIIGTDDGGSGTTNANANAAPGTFTMDSASTGLLFTFAALGLLGVGFFTVLALYNRGLLAQITPVKQVKFFTILGSVLGLVSMAMSAAWAQNKNTDVQTGYLGIPSWATNPFAWHVILMVSF